MKYVVELPDERAARMSEIVKGLVMSGRYPDAHPNSAINIAVQFLIECVDGEANSSALRRELVMTLAKATKAALWGVEPQPSYEDITKYIDWLEEQVSR